MDCLSVDNDSLAGRMIDWWIEQDGCSVGWING